MKLFVGIRSLVVMIIAGSLLVACGGGGSSSSAGTGSTGPDVQITSLNSREIAKNAYQGFDASEVLSLKSNSDIQSNAIVISNMPRLLRDIVIGNSRRPNSSLARVDQCSVSGSITSPDTADGLGTYLFDNCRQSSDGVINGSITISGTGDVGGDMFSGSFVFSQFSISGSIVPQTLTVDGSFNFSWSIVAAIETGTIAANYTVTIGATSISVSGLSSSYTDDFSTDTTTDTINYSITSSAIGGTVTVATIEPFISLNSEDYPRSGQLLITGASGSTLRLTILGSGASNGLVRLEVDSDGDGVYEDSREISWATLES